MRFHPLMRTVIGQTAALAAFLLFLSMMHNAVPPRPASLSTVRPPGAMVFVSLARRRGEAQKETPAKAPTDQTSGRRKPRPPERFRPSARRIEDASTTPKFPPAVKGRKRRGDTVIANPRPLPLSYLMKFRNMDEFHAFLDKLPDVRDDESRTMSLIRIEGLPSAVPEMRRLFESYRMEPFLFNPKRFNYLITADLKLLKERAAIRDYISAVGRYLREDEPNGAYLAIRDDIVGRARRKAPIVRAISDPTEFDRMHLGLASAYLTRFLRRLEADTARQLTELTGKSVKVGDIARIDCRFKDVNGVMVLVPWKAWLGSGPHRPIQIWKNG